MPMKGITVVDALGRTSYTPQPKVPRGISEPRSVGARIPMPWAGFSLRVGGLLTDRAYSLSSLG
jgi:hypothetical protein